IAVQENGKEGKRVFVENLSKYGTFVNERRCSGYVEVRNGDRITFAVLDPKLRQVVLRPCEEEPSRILVLRRCRAREVTSMAYKMRSVDSKKVIALGEETRACGSSAIVVEDVVEVGTGRQATAGISEWARLAGDAGILGTSRTQGKQAASITEWARLARDDHIFGTATIDGEATARVGKWATSMGDDGVAWDGRAGKVVSVLGVGILAVTALYYGRYVIGSAR
ncbi:hypothetical protein HK101_010859, partial [Irineochytrium annulatum]